MIKQTLDQNWILRPTSNLANVPAAIRGAIIRATVPGSVHTDLMRAGLIPDPYYGLNESKLLWIGETDWEFGTRFDADEKLFEHERIDLCFDGLDTVAEIWLNGKSIARTENMHRRYRFNVKSHLRKGRNELVIRFRSPVAYANEMQKTLGFLPLIQYQAPYNFIRKMACNFGWDWGPMVATCGVWKPVRLEGWSIARFLQAEPRIIKAVEGEALLDIQLDCVTGLLPDKGMQAAVEVVIRGPLNCSTTLKSEDEYRFDFRLESEDEQRFSRTIQFKRPELWWPVGHGEQPLYEIEIVLRDDKDRRIDERTYRIGLRTVELDTAPDDIGRPMVLKINGKPIFCKGYNWIPDDCFLERACEPGRVRRRIQQALDSNANMLRVWGGGIYETDDFYDICDELGILVWQDFLFACAAYPEAELFKSEVEAEARDNVARLAHHPSLVLWNGCNENVWMFRDTASPDETGKAVPWKEQLDTKQWGQGYYFDLLPRVVKEVDPTRPYWAASPWSGDADFKNGVHPNAETHGNKHIWEVWHGKGDYNTYREFSPRFCSEFGYQGPANFATMRRWFDAKELTPKSATTALHQKSPGGNERNERLLLKDFDVPDNFDDWHYLLQLNQARALTAGVEWFRSRQPVCMGTLYWQLNDCYPVTSWSAIDSDGRLKPLWFASKRFFAPRLLTIQPDSGGLRVFANNDDDSAWRGKLQVRRMDFSGRELAAAMFDLNVNPRTNAGFELPGDVSLPQSADQEWVLATIDSYQATWFFLPDRKLKYPAAKLSGTIQSEGSRHLFTLHAESFVRDLIINIDRIDPAATISDNVLTFLPGESKTLTIVSTAKLSVDELLSAPVYQAVNRFGA